MRFLVDECTGPAVARWLSDQGHDVFSVYDQARGATGDEIIHKAFTENRILISNDKDFGEKIFREQLPHRGVILLRLVDERSQRKITAMQHILSNYHDRLENSFVVVTETKVRIISK